MMSTAAISGRSTSRGSPLRAAGTCAPNGSVSVTAGSSWDLSACWLSFHGIGYRQRLHRLLFRPVSHPGRLGLRGRPQLLQQELLRDRLRAMVDEDADLYLHDERIRLLRHTKARIDHNAVRPGQYVVDVLQRLPPVGLDVDEREQLLRDKQRVPREHREAASRRARR